MIDKLKAWFHSPAGNLFLITGAAYVLLIAFWVWPAWARDLPQRAMGMQTIHIIPDRVNYDFLLEVDIYGVPNPGGVGSTITYTPRLRLDNFAFFTGFWLIGTLTLINLETQSKLNVGGFRITTTVGVSPSDMTESSGTVSPKDSAEAFLLEDVAAARDLAAKLFGRSNLMLLVGIIMAFIGALVFYVTLPEFPTNGDRWTYLERSIRPTGVLIFVESIAWFLLRQYRALIEDFKGFHKLYLKRMNYLVALKMLSSDEVPQPRMFWAAAVLTEDLTGKLQAGETTEQLESIKAIEPNPIWSVLHALIESSKKK